MLWSIHTCQNKVSAKEYRGPKFRAHRVHVVFLKLAADQVLVFDWIAGSRGRVAEWFRAQVL